MGKILVVHEIKRKKVHFNTKKERIINVKRFSFFIENSKRKQTIIFTFFQFFLLSTNKASFYIDKKRRQYLK